jgi:hypothetical protein
MAARRAVFMSIGVAGLACSQTGGLMTWGVQTNTPQWNQDLKFSATRQGCSDTPATCVRYAAKTAQTHDVKVFLAVKLNATNTADYASQYSQLSLKAPFLTEIGIDDFQDQYHAMFRDPSVDPPALLKSVIANLKSANGDLKFGATLYESDLASPYLQDAKLPAVTRAQFDFIHLYLHFRDNGPKYADYVKQARQMFPHARIIAGSYAYDRKFYLPCSPGGKMCTAERELDLYRESIALQMDLLTKGAIEYIEFYPAYFGNEDKWTGWSNVRSCAPDGLPACIANTKAMRQAALDVARKR